MKSKTKIIARYAETDQMGIVHHSVYPVWYEVGRTDFIKLTGITYSQLEKDGLMLPLISLECKYIFPIKYEDEVIIETSVSMVKCSRVEFSYKVIKDNVVCSTGKTVHGFVDSKTFKPVNAKKLMPEVFENLKNAVEQE